MPPPSQPHLPYSVSLSPDEARASATSGASLLLLDVPPGTIVGIDHRSFIAGPNFKGVKMIPTVSENEAKGGGGGGAHFVATNATGAGAAADKKGTSVGPTNFFFFHASVPGSVTVRRWSPEHEVLVPLEDEDEAERYAAGVRRFDFDANLAPYDFGSWALWQSLTRFVSPRTTARIAPAASSKAVAMSVVAEAEEAEKRRQGGGKGGRALPPPTEAERKLDEQLERGRKSAAGGGGSAAPLPPDDAVNVVVPDVVGAPRYVELPRHAVVARGGGSSGSVGGGVGGGEKQAEKGAATAALPPPPPPSSSLLTAANLDKTSTLQAVVRSPPFCGDARELLGEFQHAFISFWAGHSLLGFGAWRECVRLVLSCEAGVCLSAESVGDEQGGDDGGGEGKETKATTTPMKVDGGFFREFVNALSAQLAVATTTTTKSGSSASSASSAPASSNSISSIIDDLLEDSFLKKVARRFLENVREASEKGGVDYYLENDDDDEKGSKTPKKVRLPPPSPELQESCARLSRVLEEGLGWAGMGKPRMKELRLGGSGKRGGGGGGGGGGFGFGGDDSDSDDSDGPVVVLDVEKGY